MQLNADFTAPAVVHADRLDWIPSPMAGVSRRMLDRLGGEVARATSIVRYDPGSRFPAHTHTGGEEFLVLEGVFQDEHGDYPAGTYVRNPPGSSHAPAAAGGCTIFVKLWQFDPEDRTHVRIDTGKAAPVPHRARPGVSVLPLYRDAHEDVRIEVWDAGSDIRLADAGGLELFVLEGGFTHDGELLGKDAWLRLPPGMELAARAGASGARVYVKSGHLRTVTAPPGS
ncbi:cupin domain-containing protein [Stappia indica]|uniref:cupin domain-containing protein n=1 Tax=Stappia indica TaxID=538381 RepID=UPI001CD56804|nr:cupin domain-containing protein [Stappia indica]MCA1298380.1 cupin domain-containing protein [Stappia indica]